MHLLSDMFDCVPAALPSSDHRRLEQGSQSGPSEVSGGARCFFRKHMSAEDNLQQLSSGPSEGSPELVLEGVFWVILAV